jgi:hypothetical protein
LHAIGARAAAGQALHREGEVTPELYRGYLWVRDHTDHDTVLAVNKQRSDAFLPWTTGHPDSPDNFYVSAFTERRVFLEGTVYTAESFRLGVAEVEEGRAVPHPDRQELNERLFETGDPDALETMYRRFGVRYLLLHKSVAGATEFLVLRLEGNQAVRARLPRIFSNTELDVYAVPPPERW